MSASALPAGRLAIGPNGALSAGHPLASLAGLRALEAGGNALDACLSAAFAAWVLMPDMCGLGGDLFVMIRKADGEVLAINGAGPSPQEGYPEVSGRREALALVPGAAAALETLQPMCMRPLADLLKPAISIAERGYVAHPLLTKKVNALPVGRFRDELLASWGVTSIGPDSVLRWPTMANTLRQIAATGDWRAALSSALPDWRERGSLLGQSDLDGFKTSVEAPVTLSVGGWKLYGQPPMSQSAATLGALGRAGADWLGEAPSAARLHVLIEAYKQAFRHIINIGHAGDIPSVLNDLLHARTIQRDRESIGPLAADGAAMLRNYGETTQCAAVDRNGTTVTLIHSLYRPFGARIISPATGLIANDRGASFTEGANGPAPGVRPRHTLVGLIAEAPDGAVYAVGTPGAQAQTQTTLQALAHLMSTRDDMTGAVFNPRWSYIGDHQVAVEADMPEAWLADLASRGHKLTLRPARDWLMGSVSLVGLRGGLCYAVADDRRNALALAL